MSSDSSEPNGIFFFWITQWCSMIRVDSYIINPRDLVSIRKAARELATGQPSGLRPPSWQTKGELHSCKPVRLPRVRQNAGCRWFLYRVVDQRPDSIFLDWIRAKHVHFKDQGSRGKCTSSIGHS